MMRLLLVTALVFLQVTMLLAQEPGNVSGGLLIWLKSNVNVYEGNGSDPAEDGDGVQFWDNIYGSNDAVNTDAGTRPVYRTGIINTHPTLEFDGNRFLDSEAVSGIAATGSFHIFLVFKQNSVLNNGGPLDDQGTFIIDRPTDTNQLTTFKIVSAGANDNRYFYQRRYDDGSNLGGPTSGTQTNVTSFVIAEYFRIRTSAASATEGIYLNGDLDISQNGPTGSMTGPVLRIGRHATNANFGLNGYFSEMALYNTSLSNTNRQRIESYLAIKYGITLDPGMDYVRADGTIIYPSTSTHSSYVYDIAGIGRDDDSALDQDDSKSQNVNSVVRVYGPSSYGDEEFLIWGSDNGTLVTPNTVDVDGTTIKRRLNRVWRVAETGNIGNITMEFDLSAVPGAKTQADLRLLIDRDGDGFADNDRTPLTGTLSGNIFTISVLAANLNNGDRFTIGTANAATTPLPIELADFNVTYESPAVVATWETASELNNDYFTLERAGTDLSFDEIGRKPGAGTSKIPHSYSMIDANPYEGTSYYRLKQTDFDGTETFSEAKSMFIEETEKKLTVFPNPNEGGKLKFSFGTSTFNLDHIEVYNHQGKSIENFYTEAKDLREYSVDLQRRLSPGLYLLRVHYNGKDEFVKLVVQSRN
jgi:hypothetical protein